MKDLLDLIVFEVGAYRHASDKAIGGRTVRWLFRMYEHVQRKRYGEMIFQIVAVEHGIERAFTKKEKRPKLPSYEEIQGQVKEQQKMPQKPAWMIEYERVNKERMVKRR